MLKCNSCPKEFNSNSSKAYHQRENHTFFNCLEKTCTCCILTFKSPIISKNNDKKNYKKCEECRELQKKLKTNDLVINTFVYNRNKKTILIFVKDAEPKMKNQKIYIENY